MNLPGQKVKTPSVQTLGVLLFGLFGFATSFVLADCMPAGAGEPAVVEHVYDGDTVKLKDGRRVRVLGINAPEVDHGDEKVGQALGVDARDAAEAFISKNNTVHLFYDQQKTDRYGRVLAHIYDSDGNSLAAGLLRAGLAFHVAVPPNLSLNDCLNAQESIARKKGLGVWSHPGWQVKQAALLTPSDTGFQRVTARVQAVTINHSVWLEVDGPLVIQIPEGDLKNFSSVNWKIFDGKRVEVRGWVVERNARQLDKKNEKKSFKALIIQPRIANNLELIP